MKDKYIFTENRITATLVSGNYIWIAFLGENNICSLYKSSVFNPDLRYWSIEISADEITSIIEDTTYIYLSLDDTHYIGAKIEKSFPDNIIYFTKDSEILEEAIDLTKDSSYIYFLSSGTISGINSKLSKHDLEGNFIENIDLTTVFNAKKIDKDANNILWVVTNDTPVKLVKIYYDTSWHFVEYILS